MVVTPGKNFQGQKGFPTPSDHPENTACRIFVVPDNDQWLGLLMAAVEALLNPYNYFNWGELSIDDTVAAWSEIVDAAYERSLTSQCAVEAITPYWEDADGGDSDDESSTLSEVWYGLWDGANIVDTIAGFVFTGFVAATFGIQGAIQFATFLTRVRLFFRTADFGAIVQIFVDGDHLFDVDTYSAEAGLKTVDLFMPASVMGFRAEDVDKVPFTLVNSGTANPLATPNADGLYAMQVIRKHISESEIAPTNIIYDPDCDCVKKDWGDGLGFVDYPQGDPRHSTIFLRPPRTTDIRCASAANMVGWIHKFIDSAISTMEAFGFLLSIVTLLFNDLALISEGFTLFVSGVTDLAGNLLTAGSVLIDASFTETEYDLLLCIFFCNMDESGNVSIDALALIESEVTVQLNTTAALVVNEILTLQGEVGLTNAGRIGTATADCDGCDCGWSRCWDFSLSGDLLNLTLNEGTYDPGHSYLGVTAGAETAIVEMQSDVITEFRCTKVTLTYSMSDASPSNGGIDIRLYNGATLVVEWHELPAIPGSHQTWTWEGDENITQVLYTVSTGTLTGATCGLEKIRMEGFGDAPDIGDSC